MGVSYPLCSEGGNWLQKFASGLVNQADPHIHVCVVHVAIVFVESHCLNNSRHIHFMMLKSCRGMTTRAPTDISQMNATPEAYMYCVVCQKQLTRADRAAYLVKVCIWWGRGWRDWTIWVVGISTDIWLGDWCTDKVGGVHHVYQWQVELHTVSHLEILYAWKRRRMQV